jgi:hypothetical protein
MPLLVGENAARHLAVSSASSVPSSSAQWQRSATTSATVSVMRSSRRPIARHTATNAASVR